MPYQSISWWCHHSNDSAVSVYQSVYLTHFSIDSSNSQVLSAVVIATKSIDEAQREKTKNCPDGSLRMILPLDVDICQTNQPCNLLLWSFVLAKTDGCGKRGVRRMLYAPSWCFWPGMDVCEPWVRGPRAAFFFSWQTVANGPGKGEHLRWRVGKKITLGELAFDIFWWQDSAQAEAAPWKSGSAMGADTSFVPPWNGPTCRCAGFKQWVTRLVGFSGFCNQNVPCLGILYVRCRNATTLWLSCP